MNAERRDRYPYQHIPTAETGMTMGEFPKPNPFDMRAGRYDVHAYRRHSSKYKVSGKKRGRSTLRRLLDAKVGHVRVGALLSPLVILVLGFLCVAAILSLFGSFGDMLEDAPYQNASLGDLQPTSTSSSEWRKGEVPFLFQTDPAWATVGYAGDAAAGARGSIGTHGCGPTCLSMAYIALTGKKDMAPVEMCAFAERNGYVDQGLTSWILMSEGAAQLGLRSQEVPASSDALKRELVAGHPIICSVGPGDFTTTGHFILIAGEDDHGKLIVHDPNSTQRSSQAWDVERILSQCRNLWSFSL